MVATSQSEQFGESQTPNTLIWGCTNNKVTWVKATLTMRAPKGQTPDPLVDEGKHPIHHLQHWHEVSTTFLSPPFMQVPTLSTPSNPGCF
jgi:hypothetical protein